MEEWILTYGEYLLPVVLIGGFAFILIRQVILNRAPEYVASATVLSRRMEPARYHGKWSSGWNYLVTFQLGNDTIELYVGETDYQLLPEGLSGTLRWQHDLMLHFEPDKEE